MYLLRDLHKIRIHNKLIKLNKRRYKPVTKLTKDINRHSCKKDIQMANKCMKWGSKSLAIREKQPKTTVTSHFTATGLATIEKSDNNSGGECGEIRILIHCWWECKILKPLWETFWSSLERLNIELTIQRSNSTPGYISKKIKMYVRTEIYRWMFMAALFIITQKWKQLKCPSTEERGNKYGVSKSWNSI